MTCCSQFMACYDMLWHFMTLLSPSFGLQTSHSDSVFGFRRYQSVAFHPLWPLYFVWAHAMLDAGQTLSFSKLGIRQQFPKLLRLFLSGDFIGFKGTGLVLSYMMCIVDHCFAYLPQTLWWVTQLGPSPCRPKSRICTKPQWCWWNSMGFRHAV